LPLVFNDKTTVIDISGKSKDEIAESVLQIVNNTEVKLGGLEGIYLVEGKKAIGFSGFASAIKAEIGLDYKDIINETMLIGVINNPIFEINNNEVNLIEDVSPVIVPESVPTEEVVVPIATEGELMTLTSASFFKTGTAEFVDILAKENAKKTISDFLDTVDFVTSKIKVIGTYSVERPSSKNDQIAEARKQVGLDILNEVLVSKYTTEEIAKITIESSAKGLSIYDSYTKAEVAKMTKDEYNKLLDGAQGIQYIVEAKSKTQTVFPIEPIAVIPDLSVSEPEPDFVLPVVSEVDPEIQIPDQKIKTSKADLFILLKVRSFQDVFPVMKSWEAKMFSDFHGFFDIAISLDTNYLLKKDWEDGIVQNKNARILFDKDKKIIMMYVYVDDTSVVLADSEQAVHEIIDRLAASKVKK
jgi:hypothetical protein